MKMYKFYILVCCSFIFGCTITKTRIVSNLPAASLNIYGRFVINKDQQVELISSAVHLGFSFTGQECRIFATLPSNQNHNYLQYVLDGVYQKRIRINAGSKEPIVIKTTTTGRHIIWIYKVTEAHTGAILIERIAGNNIISLKRPTVPLIEFIGNSITCGAAADPSEVPCGTGEYQDQHNAYYAYGPRIARALNTNFILSSVSGIGVYRNWNSVAPAMPQVYEKTDFQDSNPQLWNFNLFTPAIVSIALGTNDFSNGDGKKQRLPFDSTAFVNSYISFAKLVKLKYPAAQIALLSSPMINGNNRLILQRCLTAVKEKVDGSYPADKKIALYFFEPMQAHGCGGHPNIADHEILANQLIPFFKNLL